MRTPARRDAGFRFTVMAMGLLPTLAFSDPHRDPHWAGRGWIPLDRIASIRPLVSSGGTPTHVRGQPEHELGMRYPGQLGSRDSSPSPAALSPPRSAAA